MAEETVYCEALDNPEPAVVIRREQPLSIQNRAFSLPSIGDRGPPPLPSPRIPFQRMNGRPLQTSFPRNKIMLAIVFGILTILAVVFIALYFSKDQKSQPQNVLESLDSNKSDVDGTHAPTVNRGHWAKIADDICVGAKNHHSKDVLYPFGASLIGGMKLVHTRGVVGCLKNARTYWGCTLHGKTNYINMYITDSNYEVIYPSGGVRLIRKFKGGWYMLPGYTATSPELVFTNFAYPKFFKRG